MKLKVTSFLVTLAAFGLAACAATDTRRSAGETIDDATITARVKAELIDNESTKARQIEVETYRGVVQLNGFVGSQTERSTAERVARSVDGVQEVHNNLKLKEAVADTDGAREPGQVVDDAT